MGSPCPPCVRGKCFMPFNWSNKVVMITGASSGIGRGLAVELARRGAKLGLVARRAELLEEIVGEVEKENGKAMGLAADVQDAAATRSVAKRLRAGFGPIDVLIANAGTGTTTEAAELDAAEVARV